MNPHNRPPPHSHAPGRDDGPLEHIDAPYNFVPLAGRVVLPDWGSTVSHDLPFRDGLSGEIPFTVTALTPLLVGDEQTKATEKAAGEVRFFRTPGNRFAIPGSSLRGMVRNVLEIASFSRFSGVDDKRYGLRDISGRYVKEAYTGRVRNRVKPGLLRLSPSGEPELVPCAMVPFSHRDLELWWQEREPIFSKKQCRTVREKYKRWEQLCSPPESAPKVADPYLVPFAHDGQQVTALGAGTQQGIPVLTGQISDSDDERRPGRRNSRSKSKYHDFIFHTPREAEAFPLASVDGRAWRDFLFVHGDEEGKNDMSWPGFWKERFWKREAVPVFYIQSAARLQIGLAYMPRLAGDFSVHDMIFNTSGSHLEEGAPDLAALLFGRIGAHPEEMLKGRIFFEPAIAEGEPQPTRQRDTILNSPKPSYFPNYLEQKAGPTPDRLAERSQYATYVETQEHRRPKLRGWKRYPARPNDEVKIQIPNGDQKKSVQIGLHTLPEQTRFNGRLVFHNLNPRELGALLWALTFGGRDNCRHGLGLGKSFGFGQVNIGLAPEEQWNLEANAPGSAPPSAKACLEAFEEYMEGELAGRWTASPQIRALLAMADPDQRAAFPGRLRHMKLNPKARENQFNEAKQRGLFLAAYGEGEAASLTAATTPATRDTPAGRWLAEKLAELGSRHHATEEDTLRGKPLADAWSAIDDHELKSAVKDEIEHSRKIRGLGEAGKKAQAIYDAD